MGKLVVVKGDPVSGTDTHNVSGQATNPSAPPPTISYTGVGDFEYHGAMTGQLSDFVRIGGKFVALVNSESALDDGESAGPKGKHSGPQGSNFVPPTPTPIAASLSIGDSPLGTGVPNTGAGSGLLTVDGVKALLDGDKIDTCRGVGGKAGSAVASQGQDFVTTD